MKCGTKLPDEALFCFKCGAKLPKMEDFADDIIEKEEKTTTITDVKKDEDNIKGADVKEEEDVEEEIEEDHEIQNDELDENDESPLPSSSGKSFHIIDDYSVNFPELICDRMFFEASLNRLRNYTVEAYDVLWTKWQKEGKITKLEDIFSFFIGKVFSIADSAIDRGYDILIASGIFTVTKEQLKNDVIEHYNPQTDLAKDISMVLQQLKDYAEELHIETELNKTHFIGGGFGLTGAIKGHLEAKALNATANSLKSFGKFITGNSDKSKLERFQKKLFSETPWETDGYFYINNVFLFVELLLQQIYQSKGIIGRNVYRQDEANAASENMSHLYYEDRISKEKYLETLCKCIEISHNRFEFMEDIYRLREDALPGLLELAKYTGDYLYLIKRVRVLRSLKRVQIVKDKVVIGEDYTDIAEYTVEDQQDLECFLNLRDITMMGKEDSIMPVFLLKGSYKIPLDKENVIYTPVGNSHVEAVIDSDHYIDFLSKKIVFKDVSFDPAYAKIVADYAKEQFEIGKKYLYSENEEDQKKAAEIFNNCIASGDPEVLYQIAMLYKDGLSRCSGPGVEAIKNQIKDLLLQAARKNHPGANLALGLSDFELEHRKIIYFEVAEELGSVEASYHIGKFYEEGHEDVGCIDFYEAEKHYKKAAEGGYLEATKALDKLAEKRKDKKILLKAARSYMEFGKKHNSSIVSMPINDINEIEKRYVEAVKAGSSQAKDELARFYDKQAYEYLKEKKTDIAEMLYQKAIDLGYTKSLIGLGNIYANDSELYDYEKALSLYKQAEEANIVESLESIGNLYFTQADKFKNEKNYIKAKEFALKAEDYGNKNARKLLSNIYENQANIDLDHNDYENAINNYKKALEYGSATAKNKLGRIYENQAKTYLDHNDYENAINSYRIAFENYGSATAKNKLGKVYIDLGKKEEKNQEYKKAKSFYFNAVQLENCEAMFLMGRLCDSDCSPFKNYEEAAIWYEKANKCGYSDAAKYLSATYIKIGDENYNSGEATRDLNKAMSFYEKALALENKEAVQRLKTLYEELGDRYANVANYEAAIFYYSKGVTLNNGDCSVKIGSLYGDKSKGMYDYGKAIDFFRNAIKLNATNGLEKAFEFKKRTDFSEKLAYYINQKAAIFKGTKYCFLGEINNSTAQKAVSSYGNGTSVSKIGILYDSTVGKLIGFSFGKKPLEGFFITFDGLLYSSYSGIINIATIEKLQIQGNSIVASPGNTVVAQLKNVTNVDVSFIESINEEVICNRESEHNTFLPLFRYVGSFNAKYGAQSCYYPIGAIPEKKLSNVLSSYARWANITSKDVLMLVDTTTFGNAKDGCVLTEKKIICSNGCIVNINPGDKLTYQKGAGVFCQGQKLYGDTGDNERDNFFVACINEALSECKISSSLIDSSSFNKAETKTETINENLSSNQKSGTEEYLKNGNKYLNGEGVAQDSNKALDWFLKGAREGDALCQYYAGYIYSSDKLGEPNYKKCKYWFTKAAENGVVEAKNYLETYKDFYATVECDLERETLKDSAVITGQLEEKNHADKEARTETVVIGSASTMTLIQNKQIYEHDFISLRQAFDEKLTKLYSGTFEVLDLIPDEKKRNAIEAYAKDTNIRENDIKVLLDGDVFGNGKEGLIITNTLIMGSKLREPILLNQIQYLSVNMYKGREQKIYAEPMHKLITILSWSPLMHIRVFLEKVNQVIFKAVIMPVPEQKFIMLKESFGQNFWKKYNDKFMVLDLIKAKAVQKVLSSYAKNCVINEADVKIILHESHLIGDKGLILTNNYIVGSKSKEVIPLYQIEHLKLEKNSSSCNVYAEPMHVLLADFDNSPHYETIINKINECVFK